MQVVDALQHLLNNIGRTHPHHVLFTVHTAQDRAAFQQLHHQVHLHQAVAMASSAAPCVSTLPPRGDSACGPQAYLFRRFKHCQHPHNVGMPHQTQARDLVAKHFGLQLVHVRLVDNLARKPLGRVRPSESTPTTTPTTTRRDAGRQPLLAARWPTCAVARARTGGPGEGISTHVPTIGTHRSADVDVRKKATAELLAIVNLVKVLNVARLGGSFEGVHPLFVRRL